MFLEVILAIAANLSTFFWIVSIVVAICAAIAFFIYMACTMEEHPSESDKQVARTAIRVFWKACIILMVALPIGTLPKVDDLWKVRVGMIKLYLASPENIKAGAEAIERVARKLECQYIGGCEEDKKQPAKAEKAPDKKPE